MCPQAGSHRSASYSCFRVMYCMKSPITWLGVVICRFLLLVAFAMGFRQNWHCAHIVSWAPVRGAVWDLFDWRDNISEDHEPHESRLLREPMGAHV